MPTTEVYAHLVGSYLPFLLVALALRLNAFKPKVPGRKLGVPTSDQ